jgi:uncharacterized protein
MIIRLLNISKKRSFFLFGARGTGKTTLLKSLFNDKESFTIDLLDSKIFAELQAYPERFEAMVNPAILANKVVVIDEVQRVPQLLNTVHKLIQKEKVIFALTGSSARKLKRGSANLLAGRASVYKLFPLLFSEIGINFSLDKALAWGTLPELFNMDDDTDKQLFLESYSETYIQEEIISEQIVRKLPPFRRFLAVAAQMNSKLINYSKISQDINTDPTNVKNYFEILEDTLLGFQLQPFNSLIRKRQRHASKFYWFDTGVARCLQKRLNVSPTIQTSDYGALFEAFCITQIKSGLEYQLPQFELSYLLTKDGAEIDLIIERAGQKTLCLEIKSGEVVHKSEISNLANLAKDIPNSQPICLYDGLQELHYDDVLVLPWKEGMIRFGLVPNG